MIFKWDGVVPNDLEYPRRDEDYITSGVNFMGIIFGLLHCLAWNYEFPTQREGLLWKIAALGTSSILFVFIFFLAALETNAKFMRVIGPIVALAYSIARLHLIVEMFRSLFYLPPEAYITTWSAGIPHVA